MNVIAWKFKFYDDPTYMYRLIFQPKDAIRESKGFAEEAIVLRKNY
jgi:hypothetical protein